METTCCYTVVFADICQLLDNMLLCKVYGIFFMILEKQISMSNLCLQKEELVDKAKDLSEEDSEAHVAKLIRFVSSFVCRDLSDI